MDTLMYTYSYVGYIILNKDWIKKYGSQWRAGRIEVDDGKSHYHIDEYGVFYDIVQMEKEMLEKNIEISFEDWLFNFTSSNKLSKKEIIDLYEQETGIKITLLTPKN